MIHLTESIAVLQNIHDVFRYVSDLSNIEQWDPGVIESKKMTPGPVRQGSEFQLKCKFFGFTFPMKYRVTKLDAPNLVVFEGQGDKFSAHDSISFSETENKTKIEYALDLEFKEASFFNSIFHGKGKPKKFTLQLKLTSLANRTGGHFL